MSAEEAIKLAKSNNDFALELFQNMLKADPKSENIFFSPFSIGTALSMAQLGAKETTASQIKSTLKLDCFTENDHHRVISEVCSKFKADEEDKYTLNVANRLFARKDYVFSKEFLANTRKLYAADAQNLDFAGDAEGSKKAMNTWVEDQTANKIKDLITDIDPQLAMVLINAIYFKGSWLEQFKPDDTHEHDFSVSETESIKVQMMYKDDKFNTGYSEELQAMSLELPYKGEELSMVCVLPMQQNGLAALEAKLTPEALKPLLACEDNMKMMVNLPKFKMECKLDLEERLKDLGMTHAFQQGTADFSGMDGSRNLFLSKVVHKAYIEVNEEGTEAAAATGLQMMLMCMPQEFRADHPFIFFIKHKPTGAALFWGRCARPSY